MNKLDNEASDLAGRVCVVTGAGSGIGRAISVALGSRGARVAVLDRDAPNADETLALVREAGGDGLAVVCDVSKQDSVESARSSVFERFGDAQILVNNAAVIRPGPLKNLPLDEWNALLSVNLTGYFLCAQVFGRAMLEKHDGALVHVASIAAEFATPFSGAYSVAKAGVTMLSRLLAVEWGPEGVRSNVVHPGLISTPMTRDIYETPGVSERRSQTIPSRRIGRPEDIAETVVFLASPMSSYVNGAEIVVDGGFTRNLVSFIPRAGYERTD